MSKPTLVLNREDHVPGGPEFHRAVHAATLYAQDILSTRPELTWVEIWASRVDGRDVVHAVHALTMPLFRKVTAGRQTKLMHRFEFQHGAVHEAGFNFEDGVWAQRS